ncbi:alkaline phosphatase [Xanthocytophaga flava]|uniref:alkaline phosphatase n=1 Tax=Xanthocytophaga flava TaxID=3048013 RepID=UPI0028D66974|nr:alkaline phosphatase [Xanthocytophaga flavus]MDJ1466893.1 alkaline phosphatase [Xanthocytophaga flavus]
MKIRFFSTLLVTIPFLTLCPSFAQKNAKSKHPKNVILLIGDGMGTAQIYAGLTANKGSLNLERFPYVGFHKNQSADDYVTDSGAGATALAIGYKANNGAIGVDSTNHARPTILEIAEHNKLSTGLVVTCSMTHATPASFIAHQPKRTMVEEIAADFLKTDVDVFIGGGRKHFTQRADGKNLVDSLRAKNYQIASSLPEVTKTISGKLAGFLADEELPKFSEGRGDQLLQSTQTALQLLTQNKKGFFLMVEGSQIDWGGHANDTQYIVNEMLDFDKVIGAVLDFAQKDGNTLVIVTADHETGGFALVGGDMKTGKVEGQFVTKHHTGVMIPVFAYGPGSEAFSGIYPNTKIFDKMLNAFGFKAY